MENAYTCSCGNQTFIIIENGVRCAVCKLEFNAPHLPVADFNRLVAEDVEELEEA